VSNAMIAVPGGRVWFDVLGEKAGTQLLCLHGGPGFPHDYLKPLSQLSDDRQVIFYDQLGCGRSERPTDPSLWTLHRALEELGAVRRALELDTFHLFGSSWGGLLAIEYALLRPPGLASLVLSSPLVSVPHWTRDAAVLKASLPDDVRKVIDAHEESGHVDCPEYAAAVLVFMKKHVCRLEPWPEELEDAYAGVGIEPYRTMWGPSEFTQTGNLSSCDPSQRLGEIEVPVLWSCGRYDEAVPASTEHFASLTPLSEFVVFENSSHMAHLEERELYLQTIGSFLERVDKNSFQ